MPRIKTAELPETAQEPASATVVPLDQEHPPAKPKSRRFLMRANDKCPKDGAFNGTCLVYEGDAFEHIFNPVWRNVRDVKGRPIISRDGYPKMGWIELRLPTWADVVEEYEIEIAPRAVAKSRLPGAAPEMPLPASTPMKAPPGLGPAFSPEGAHR